MNTCIPSPTLRRLTLDTLLWTALCLLSLVPSMPARSQPVYPAPWSFTTVTIKAAPGASSNATSFTKPRGLAVDDAGNIYVAGTREQVIYRITSAGQETILAGCPGVCGSADGTAKSARFRYPHGLAVDKAGNVYVADSGNDEIRLVTPAGVVTTLAGLAHHPGGADGTSVKAKFNYPSDVALDGAGNVYVSDQNNSTIRKVTTNGVVTTFAGKAGEFGARDGAGTAAQFSFPAGIAVGGDGTVYVADIMNNAIRQVTPDGVVTTLAGGLTFQTGAMDGSGAVAQFHNPCDVAVDRKNHVFVADTFNRTIREILPDGTVTTIAGLAGQEGAVDGCGSAARFSHPFALAVDRSGNLYVADCESGAIRKGAPAVRTPLPAAGTSFSFTSR